MNYEPWTSPDAPAWKRAMAYGVILGVSALIVGLSFAKPIVWAWRAVAGD